MAAPPPIPLDYLVILDLEAYCDNPADPHGPEIVEFPFLVYDLTTQTVVDHKQIYIAPHWSANPNPPPDVVQAFGIDVAFAPTLADAIAQFDAYVYQSFVVARKSFYLVTDGHWDITRYLYFEAARKAVLLSPYFRVFFDLRAEFCKCYPSAPPPHDRNSMFQYLRVPPPARGASGIDECIGLAALVSRFLRDGHRFTQPEVVADAEWSALNARVPGVATPVAAAQPVGAVIRLRGLPWASSERDVEKFLAGIPIVPRGIHFVRNVYGKVTGEAFVQLESPDGVVAALARHKRSVGRRYIEVFKSSPVDMANHLGRADAKRHLYAGAASATGKIRLSGGSGGGGGGTSGGRGGRNANSGNSGGGGGGGGVRNSGNSGKDNANRYVIKVTGLPGDASTDDVALLMEGVQITGEGVQLVVRSNGLCVGDAYVEVASEAHVKKALSRTGTSLPITRVGYGDAARYVTVDVRKSSISQLRTVIYGNSATSSSLPMDNAVGTGGVTGPTNTSTSMLEGNAAVKQDRGRRTSPGRNISGNGATSGLHSTDNIKNNNNGGGGNNRSNSSHSKDERIFVAVRNVPETASISDVVELMEGLGVTESDVKLEESDHLESNDRKMSARVSIRSREERNAAIERSGRIMKGHEISVVTLEVSKSHHNNNNNGNKNNSRSGGGGGANGRGSKVVRMRGLPFSAGDEEIIQFFDGYQIVDGGIARGRDRHGRASGEACVTFATENEACEAVRKLDKKHIGTRYIELRF